MKKKILILIFVVLAVLCLSVCVSADYVAGQPADSTVYMDRQSWNEVDKLKNSVYGLGCVYVDLSQFGNKDYSFEIEKDGHTYYIMRAYGVQSTNMVNGWYDFRSCTFSFSYSDEYYNNCGFYKHHTKLSKPETVSVNSYQDCCFTFPYSYSPYIGGLTVYVDDIPVPSSYLIPMLNFILIIRVRKIRNGMFIFILKGIV